MTDQHYSLSVSCPWLIVCGILSAVACAPFSDGPKQTLNETVNCQTAEGDLRSLEHERIKVAEQLANGVTAIHPTDLVVGVVTGIEGDKPKIAIDRYNEMINKKEAEIRAACGL